MPDKCVAFAFQQAFRTGESRIKVRVARVQPEKTEDSNRPPRVDSRGRSTNFHGVELKVIGEPIVIDHRSSRTYEFRVRMENVSVPNTGRSTTKTPAVNAVWNSARTIKGEANPPRMKVEWIELESPYLETLAAGDAFEHSVRQQRIGGSGIPAKSSVRFATRA